jgi:hypothetical protein
MTRKLLILALEVSGYLLVGFAAGWWTALGLALVCWARNLERVSNS